MESITTRAVLVRSEDKLEYFFIEVNKKNCIMVRRKLEQERRQIVEILKSMKKHKIIKSIWIPKNKDIQDKLDSLVRAKRTIDQSLESIKEFFYR